MTTGYPGSHFFGPGQCNEHITRLGRLLIERGGRRFYRQGPGPQWSTADLNATRAFQQAQGWTDHGADGIPGPRTWDYLVSGRGKDIPATSAVGIGGASGGSAVPSPVPGHRVTYAFGTSDSGYSAGYHTGDDYAAPIGTPVVAVRSGTIAWSNSQGRAYGNWIGLEADNGRTYVYCHLSERSVTDGQQVRAGEPLGKVGATGNVTGPHLHFEDRPHGGQYGDVRKPAW
ncbi:M23 family metallopeptidase [Streptomyces sp. AV19]|uniref:peptidoglycan-binding protein n=1 Tax=Streptomyces sp. AV19 TaxID=2793068 RepID=UPI0018FEF835|nr:peptidoglycan-binding protein [Streptomyces sp. AV19]MBH1939089.1 M23 family metallopeptidase [Streptomyces sp. AV19]MDG4536939.1 peptidoglycan-binding protein [Streptomyces sp. AV19]